MENLIVWHFGTFLVLIVREIKFPELNRFNGCEKQETKQTLRIHQPLHGDVYNSITIH